MIDKSSIRLSCVSHQGLRLSATHDITSDRNSFHPTFSKPDHLGSPFSNCEMMASVPSSLISYLFTPTSGSGVPLYTSSFISGDGLRGWGATRRKDGLAVGAGKGTGAVIGTGAEEDVLLFCRYMEGTSKVIFMGSSAFAGGEARVVLVGLEGSGGDGRICRAFHSLCKIY